MKCQKCGANLQAGHLYCDTCGAEYQMVPDFEAELEISMAETLSEIRETVEEETAPSSLGITVEEKKEKKEKQPISFMKIFLVLLLCGGILAVGVYFYRNSVSYKSSQAARAQEVGQYLEAAAIYGELRKKQPDDAHWYIEEARMYQFLNEKEEAENLGVSAVKREKNQEEAYTFLLDFYYQEARWQEMHHLLLDCKYEALQEKYALFLAEEPVFNFESGTYKGNLEITMENKKPGDIFYTLDGTLPNADDNIYTAPIKLGNGTHTIKAVFRNQYGVFSDMIERKYEISADIPLAPVVEPESGTYKISQMIEIQVEEGTKVYYTTDISNLDENGILYTEPIPMPLGESSFAFIAYSEAGLPGEITWRDYMLNIKTGLTLEEAESVLVQKLIARGSLLDRNGALQDRYGVHRYFYDYPIAIGDNNYYVFSEHYLENEINDLTGSYYAVEVINGDAYRLLKDENGEFQLAEF